LKQYQKEHLYRDMVYKTEMLMSCVLSISKRQWKDWSLSLNKKRLIIQS